MVSQSPDLNLGLREKLFKNHDLDSHKHVILFLHIAILKHFISWAESLNLW